MSERATAPGIREALRARAPWIGAYAVCTFLAFRHPLGSVELDLGWLFAWLSPATFLVAVRGLGPRRAAQVGFFSAWLAHSLVLHWIYVVTVRYGGASPVVGVIAPVLLATYMGLAGAALGAGVALLRSGPLPLFAVAALWVVVEHGRTFVLTGFPWALLGYAQHQNPLLMGLAPLAGVFGLSFAIVLGGAAIQRLATRRERAVGAREAVAALAVVLALHAVGAAARGPSEPAAPVRRVRMAVAQGNVDQGIKWSPERVEEGLENYAELTRAAVAEGAEVVVWPETAVTAPPESFPAVTERLEGLARETGATLVVGAVGLERPERFSKDPPRIFDSAFVVDPVLGIRDRYDKTKLVPFGEYLPLRDVLGRFVRAVATGSAGLDVTPGPAPRRIELEAREGEPMLPAGVPICYELLFPDLVRRFVDDGSGVLLGITNDAWYGRSGAPLQFLVMTAMRSAENGVWTVRAANTGVSAFIDARGRVLERTELFERGTLVREVPVLPPGERATFYTRHGDVFVAACWAFVLGVGILGVARRRTAAPTASRR